MQPEQIKEQYSIIAKSFNKTRFEKWDCVLKFLQDVKSTDKILELGCGNGKNIYDLTDQSLGVDICPELCDISRSRGVTVIESDILLFNTYEKYDYILCVAVIHHLSNFDDRVKLLRKIKSFLKEDGKALITCWTTNEVGRDFSHGDNYVKFGSINRYYYISEPTELLYMCRKEFNIIEYYQEYYNDVIIVK